MSPQFLRWDRVTFAHDGASQPLFERLTVQLPTGWTGVIGANGAGKTTWLRLACGELTPRHGRIIGNGHSVLCAQRTDVAPAQLAGFLHATDATARRVRGMLAIGARWDERWHSLSHGERKRAQIATALWQQPCVLALDEPTNHLDATALALLREALREFSGIGLIVSHDRDLLDALCTQCLVLDAAGATLRPGGYHAAMRLAAADVERDRTARASAVLEMKRLERAAAQRKHTADRADQLRSKQHLDARDRDGRARIDLARVSGKDGQAGRLLRQMAARVDRARAELARMPVRKRPRLGITMCGARSRADRLVQLPAGNLLLGDGRRVHHPELTVRPTDRVGLTGANGAGKSTLIARLIARLELPTERCVLIPQEIDRAAAIAVLNQVRNLPRGARGDVFATVNALGSLPERLLESAEPSPGELRKILLALGLARRPYLVVMDEPTNHLDVPSIECLERALRDVACALVLVSHDLRFLRTVTTMRWEIADLKLQERPWQ